jgi:8-oxo-dGTP diphosphatase
LAVIQLRVSVVILIDGRRMLVNRRPEGTYFGGWWEWPGGKCLAGESFEDCARRELREEIGLEAVNLQEYDRRQVSYPGRVIELVFFTGKVKPGSKPSADALEHTWMTVEEVHNLKFLEPNQPVLERLARQLKQQ